MSRRAALVAALSAALVLAVVAVFVLVLRDDGPPRAERLAAVRRYLTAVEPLAKQGGGVVQLGMKPGIAELQRPGPPPADLADRAGGWERTMTTVRGSWAAVPTPSDLVPAHTLFLSALDGYVQTAAAIGRTDEVSAIQLGETTDDVWDLASRRVQDVLRSLGAEPVDWLTDKAVGTG